MRPKAACGWRGRGAGRRGARGGVDERRRPRDALQSGGAGDAAATAAKAPRRRIGRHSATATLRDHSGGPRPRSMTVPHAIRPAARSLRTASAAWYSVLRGMRGRTACALAPSCRTHAPRTGRTRTACGQTLETALRWACPTRPARRRSSPQMDGGSSRVLNRLVPGGAGGGRRCGRRPIPPCPAPWRRNPPPSGAHASPAPAKRLPGPAGRLLRMPGRGGRGRAGCGWRGRPECD